MSVSFGTLWLVIDQFIFGLSKALITCIRTTKKSSVLEKILWNKKIRLIVFFYEWDDVIDHVTINGETYNYIRKIILQLLKTSERSGGGLSLRYVQGDGWISSLLSPGHHRQMWPRGLESRINGLYYFNNSFNHSSIKLLFLCIVS